MLAASGGSGGEIYLPNISLGLRLQPLLALMHDILGSGEFSLPLQGLKWSKKDKGKTLELPSKPSASELPSWGLFGHGLKLKAAVGRPLAQAISAFRKTGVHRWLPRLVWTAPSSGGCEHV